jgi:beta-lactamase regulating signal transducer with metallopeptidase domain
MNFPNFTFWWHLLGTLAIEVCCVAALGWVAQRLFRQPVWQQTIWQLTVVCLLLLPASEWTGFGRGMAWYLVGPKREANHSPTSDFAKAGPVVVRQLALPLSYRVPPPQKPAVWWLGWVWLAGAVVVLGRMAAAQILLLTLRLRRDKITNDALRERVLNVARSVGLRRRICLLRMPESISPMAFGILRLNIGLPPEFEARFSATEQDAVLAHELAHLGAMDPLWFLAADFASALLWWHPLAWWVRRSLHVSSELAADEATALVADGPGALAKCLVVLGKEMTAGRGWGWVGINGGFRSKLGKRVERLMLMPSGRSRTSASWTSAAAKFALTIIVGAAVVLLSGTIQTAEGESENGWRESWINSPGGLLLLATQDQPDKRKDDTATRIQDGKLFYEMGKLDEAEAILVEVMKDDPSNRTAPYFLDLIKEARYVNRERTHKGAIVPIPLATNNIVYTRGRREILSKLDRIYFDEVSFDLPLTKVLTQLRAQSQKRDPGGKGIDFFFVVSQIETPANVPVGAIPVEKPTPAVDVSTVQIKISPALSNLRLSDVLNAITMVADQPIKYTVEDYGVVFSAKQAEVATLYSKVFHVDPDTFVNGLKNFDGANSSTRGSNRGEMLQTEVDPRGPADGHDSFGGPGPAMKIGLSAPRTNTTVASDNLLRNYFSNVGINLNEPGKSIFFNNRTGLLLVRATANDLEIVGKTIEALAQMPPQVTVSAKFVELSQQEGAALGFNWFLQTNTTNSSGIMSDPQFRLAMNAIEHKTGEDILGMPRGTIVSGRRIHLGTDKGPTLDVLPVVGPDGFSIRLAVSASFKSGNQVWQAAASREIWDGDTLVMSQSITNQAARTTKLGLVFITVRIIDAAGNAMHADDEISKGR